MNATEAWAKVEAAGYTKHKISDDYVVLQGPDGVISGIANLDRLSPEERTAELAVFWKRNMLS